MREGAVNDVLIGAGTRRVLIGNDRPLSLIAGPCALEGRDMALRLADELARLADRFKIGVVFKASYDKANRTSHASPRGVGLAAALPIFRDIKAAWRRPQPDDPSILKRGRSWRLRTCATRLIKRAQSATPACW
jgi:2-dehydro-3-deoxyphosphooctonate aldolase (KDO 8-P synthase)